MYFPEIIVKGGIFGVIGIIAGLGLAAVMNSRETKVNPLTLALFGGAVGAAIGMSLRGT